MTAVEHLFGGEPKTAGSRLGVIEYLLIVVLRLNRSYCSLHTCTCQLRSAFRRSYRRASALLSGQVTHERRSWECVILNSQWSCADITDFHNSRLPRIAVPILLAIVPGQYLPILYHIFTHHPS
jgi:hypothetical protein